MKESKIEQHLARIVQARGGLALKFVSPGSAGVPDRLVLMPGGRVGMIELKAPGQQPRPLQLRWMERLSELGVPCGWSDSIDGVEDWVQRIAGEMHTTAKIRGASRARVPAGASGAPSAPASPSEARRRRRALS